jgi:hypothetical protein
MNEWVEKALAIEPRGPLRERRQDVVVAALDRGDPGP